MRALGVIDIGGTTIKFAVWQNRQLVAKKQGGHANHVS